MEPSKAGPLEVLPRDVSPGYVSWARAPGSETLQTSRTRKGGAHHPLGNPSRDGAGQQSCPQVWLSGQVTCPVSKITSYLPGPQGQHSQPSPAEGPRPGGLQPGVGALVPLGLPRWPPGRAPPPGRLWDDAGTPRPASLLPGLEPWRSGSALLSLCVLGGPGSPVEPGRRDSGPESWGLTPRFAARLGRMGVDILKHTHSACVVFQTGENRL